MDIKGILSYNDKNLEISNITERPLAYYEYLYNTQSIDEKNKELNFKAFTAFENLIAFNFDFVVDNLINTYSILKPNHLLLLTPDTEWKKIIYYYYKNILAKKEKTVEEIWKSYKEHNENLKEIRKYYPDFYNNQESKISETDQKIIFSIFLKLHALVDKILKSNYTISETSFKEFERKYNYKVNEIEYNISRIIDTTEYSEANLIKLKFNNEELHKFIDIALKRYVLLDESEKESIKLKKLIELCINTINHNNRKIKTIDECTLKKYKLIPSK